LSVSKVGDGAGTVVSTPTGIDCGSTCSHAFDYGTEVTLTAVPAAGSSFTGWANGCSGIGSCTLTMTGARSVAAIFDREKGLTVAKTGTGSGSITSNPSGIDCGATCAHAFSHGASVTLTASPAADSTFIGWTGACSGAGPCTLQMNADQAAIAEFRANPPNPPPPPPPPACVVPRLQRKTLGAAKRMIRTAHCRLGAVRRAYSRRRKGTVLSQRPAPGTRRPAGTRINLVVSKGRRKH